MISLELVTRFFNAYEVQAIVYRGIPLVLHFQREEDCQWKPFELHLARCSKWGPALGMAVSTGRTTPPGPPARGRKGGWGDGGYSSDHPWVQQQRRGPPPAAEAAPAAADAGADTDGDGGADADPWATFDG